MRFLWNCWMQSRIILQLFHSAISGSGLSGMLIGAQYHDDIIFRHYMPVQPTLSLRPVRKRHRYILLSLAACRQQEIAVEMLIYNRFPPADPLIEQETAEYLQRYLRQHFPQTAFEYMDGQKP